MQCERVRIKRGDRKRETAGAEPHRRRRRASVCIRGALKRDRPRDCALQRALASRRSIEAWYSSRRMVARRFYSGNHKRCTCACSVSVFRAEKKSREREREREKARRERAGASAGSKLSDSFAFFFSSSAALVALLLSRRSVGDSLQARICFM